MAKPIRKKLFVDRNLQGALLKRIVMYWAFCLLFVTVPLLIGKSFTEPDQILAVKLVSVWSLHWPVFLTMLLLLPFVLYDALKLSNRFAGPLFRLRREMGRLANGDDVAPIKFRDHDFLQDLADRFNMVVDRLETAERQKTGETDHAAELETADAT